jgi:hypothetical protein
MPKTFKIGEHVPWNSKAGRQCNHRQEDYFGHETQRLRASRLA